MAHKPARRPEGLIKWAQQKITIKPHLTKGLRVC
jgi:hypothetical protein